MKPLLRLLLILLPTTSCKTTSHQSYEYGYSNGGTPQAPRYLDDDIQPEKTIPGKGSPEPQTIGELIKRGHKIYFVEENSEGLQLTDEEKKKTKRPSPQGEGFSPRLKAGCSG